MSDFDRLLKDALRSAGDSHRLESTHGARSKFITARRRRTLFTAATSVAVLAALMVTAVVAAPWDRRTDLVAPPPEPAAPQGEMLVTQRIPADSSPSSLDFEGTNLYVGHAEDPTVGAIDVNKNEYRTIVSYSIDDEAGMHPAMHVAVHGSSLYTAGRGEVSVEVIPKRLDEGVSTVIGYPWEGDISDLLVTSEATWVAGADPSGDVNSYAIAALDPDLSGRQDLIHTEASGRLDEGFGYVWLTQSPTGGGLARKGPSSSSVEEIDQVGAATDVSAGGGAVWTFAKSSPADGVTYRLTRIDPESAEVTDRFDVPGYFARVEASDDLGIFVMSKVTETQSKLFRIDPVSGDILGEPLDFGPGPFALESGFRSLWVADQLGDKVYRVEVGETASPQPEVDGGNDKKRAKKRALEGLEAEVAARLAALDANQTTDKELLRLIRKHDLSPEGRDRLQVLMLKRMRALTGDYDTLQEAIDRAIEEASQRKNKGMDG